MKELVAIAEQVAAKLIERHETIAVAESSTGGLISAALLAVRLVLGELRAVFAASGLAAVAAR